MSNDTEDGRVQVQFVNGYASLAAFITSDADKSTAIYRRFDRLSVRNLLFLQSELEELQALQDEYDREDDKGTTEQQATKRNLTTLKERARGSDGNAEAAQKRLELQREIAEKLKGYSKQHSYPQIEHLLNLYVVGEVLIFESTLLSLKAPAPSVLKAFRKIYNNYHIRGTPFPALGGSSEHTYAQNDLITLKQLVEEDRLTWFLRIYFPFLFIVS